MTPHEYDSILAHAKRERWPVTWCAHVREGSDLAHVRGCVVQRITRHNQQRILYLSCEPCQRRMAQHASS
jgi:hypothetical protein